MKIDEIIGQLDTRHNHCCEISECTENAIVYILGTEVYTDVCKQHAQELCQQIMKLISNETTAGTTNERT